MVMKTNLKMFTTPPRGAFEGEKMSSRVRGGMAWGTFWTTSIQQSHPARLGAWWGPGLDLLHMESVKGQAIRLWSIEQGARANINSRTSRKARKSSNLDQGYHSKGEVIRKFWTRTGSDHLTGILKTSSFCQYCDKSTDKSMCFLRAYLSIYNVNVLRTKEILGCD